MFNQITKYALFLAVAFSLPVAACGGEAKKGDEKQAKVDKKADASKADEKKAEDPTPEAGPKPSMDSPEGRVAIAASIASQIAKTPENADAILGDNGLDREQLEALMYEIARDPKLSQAYKEKRMNG